MEKGPSGNCRMAAVALAVVYVIIQIFRINADTRGTWERSARDLSNVRLPNLYLCPAGAEKRDALVRWALYNCSLRYRKEHVPCHARERSYDGYPEDFGLGSGRCLEFLSSNLMIGEEWTPAWNELTLYAAWEEQAGQTNDLQEVELGYRPIEWELDNSADKDRFYYPMLRIPTFDFPVSGPSTGVATRVFLGEEKDVGRRYAGKYWYTYDSTFPVIKKPSLPSTALDHVYPQTIGAENPNGPVKVVAAKVILTLEEFSLFLTEYTQQPVIYSLVAVMGELAGVATLLLALTHRFSSKEEAAETREQRNIRDPEYLELATAEKEDYRNEAGGEMRDEGSRQGLLDVGACSDSEKIE